MSAAKTERLGPTRAEVLHHLRTRASAQGVEAVALALGLHPNTTRFHLGALTEAGLVVREVENRGRPGRPRMLFRAVPGLGGDHYEALAEVLVRHFASGLDDRAERAENAGLAWGQRLREQRDPQSSDQPVERLVNAMDALGYQPQRDQSDDATVVLRPCPFLNLAGDDPDVICRLHVGLANGLLGPDQPWRVTDIEPFATPTTCVLRLQHLAAAEPSAANDHVA